MAVSSSIPFSGWLVRLLDAPYSEDSPPDFPIVSARLRRDQFAAFLSQQVLVAAREGIVSIVRGGSSRGNRSAGSDDFGYHFDGAYLRNPPPTCILYCEDPGRGDVNTSFIRTDALYDAAIHNVAAATSLLGWDWCFDDRVVGSVQRPLVQFHQESGQPFLRFCAHYGRLVERGRSDEDSRSLNRVFRRLSLLCENVDSFEWRWRATDCLLWDNALLLHARRSPAIDRSRRLLRAWSHTPLSRMCGPISGR